jgi:serine/threonine protein kinase
MKINKRTNKKTRKRINKVKKTIRKIKGGAPAEINFIGQGTYGCVYSPKLKCLGQNGVNDDRVKIISKLMTNDNAYAELNENIILDILEYDTEYTFHLPLPTICKLNIKPRGEFNNIRPVTLYPLNNNLSRPFSNIRPLNLNQPNNSDEYYKMSQFNECNIADIKLDGNQSVLNYHDGGKDFSNLKDDKINFYPKKVFSETGLFQILNGIIELQKKGFIHCDIKNVNIVTGCFNDPQNPGSINFKLIDFGFLTFTGEIDFTPYTTNPIFAPIFNEKDILTGEQKQINKIPIDFNYAFYPIYGILFNFDIDYQENIDDLIEDKINWFMTNMPAGQNEFYSTLNIYRKNSFIKRLKTMFNDLESDYYLDMAIYHAKLLILAKKIDFYSFGVVLLMYLDDLKSIAELEEELEVTYKNIVPIVELHLYYFLKTSRILFHNFEEITYENIKFLFEGMCDRIIFDIDALEAPYVPRIPSQLGGKVSAHLHNPILLNSNPILPKSNTKSTTKGKLSLNENLSFNKKLSLDEELLLDKKLSLEDEYSLLKNLISKRKKVDVSQHNLSKNPQRTPKLKQKNKISSELKAAIDKYIEAKQKK